MSTATKREQAIEAIAKIIKNNWQYGTSENTAKAAITAYEQAMDDCWLMLESAPRDGQQLLVGGWHKKPFAPDTVPLQWIVGIAYWTDFNGGGWVSHTLIDPQYWQPLPQPPKQGGEA